ncbi:hypothetical protein [Ammoniphilus oxalaticus]|nr:hypothetical protein [Ammoniphilus oxalaticus]
MEKRLGLVCFFIRGGVIVQANGEKILELSRMILLRSIGSL